MWTAVLNSLPRGHTLDDKDFQRRHRVLLWVLAAHVPGLALFGVLLDQPTATTLWVLLTPTLCVVLGWLLRRHRRTASTLVTAGLVYCSAALVGLTEGTIESHFHFFIIIGFIALYQDWVPFLFNVLFTIVSHGIGSVWQGSLMFNHPAAQDNPWLWSVIHGVAVLFGCVGMTLFWRFTEETQQEKNRLAQQLAEAEINRRQFTSDLLLNLARRNQSMLYRQLDIINQLEENERDPDALAELFKLDHLATRVRRNAESLLVLSGEQPPRVWSDPVPLRDVVRAAIAETEDLERVVFTVDEQPAVAGYTVADLTHLLAELTENAVRYSPPDTVVTIRARPDRNDVGGQLLTVEDWGVGMPPEQLAEANAMLANPPEVDLSVSQRLGFHVVARLAARHGVSVSLSTTPGSGITAVVALPSGLFEPVRRGEAAAATARAGFADPVERGELQAAGGPGPDASAESAVTATLTLEPIVRDQPPALPQRQPGGSGSGNGSQGHSGPSGPVRAFGVDEPWSGWWRPVVTDGEPSGDGAVFAPAPGAVPTPRPRPEPGAEMPRRGSAALDGSTPARPEPAGPPPGIASRPGPATSPPGPVASLPTRAEPGRGEPGGPLAAGGLGTGASGTPEPGSPAEAPAAPVEPLAGLRKRVPQSHLVPELRRPAPESEPPARPETGHTHQAAAALSRYQASREAARSVVDGDTDDTGGGERR